MFIAAYYITGKVLDTILLILKNDAEYCSDCKTVINEAIKTVPVRFRSIWVKTGDVSVETLTKHRKHVFEKQQKEYPDRIIGEIVVCQLFDMADSKNIFSGFGVSFQGKEYLVETWTKTPEKNMVKVKMEENIMTDERKFWQNV